MKVSATKHHCLSGDKYKASRPLDYIYDPLFTFSGPKDYYRAAHESLQTSSEFSVQPIFDSMFSDMLRFPRATLVLRPSHRLPGNIDTSYSGRVKAISQERTITAEVTGTDRFKYFRRPVTEPKDGSPSETTTRFPLLGLESMTSMGLLAPPTTAQKPPTRYAATQVRATQTDYRESEAQTKPWTPPYTVHGDSTPEVLYLEQLSWGKGLPPGVHEVEIVERLRRKRAWETRLPPPDCPSNISVRYKLIAEMEKSDWQFREKEIELVHKERMKLSEQLLEKHNLMNRSRLNCRMEFLQDDFNRRKERKLLLIRHDKERALRKLCMREKGYDPKKYKMSVLDEHLKQSSELYAPVKRNGVSFKNRHESLAQKQFTIDDGDVCDLVFAPTYRPVFDFHKASQPKRQTELCVRETRWTMDNLVKLHQDLQKLRTSTTRLERDAPYAGMEARPKPSVRPDAPMLECAKRPLTEEAMYQAAILIQRVVHSRSMQALMEQKRDAWKELMEELKTSRVGHPQPGEAVNHDDIILKARMTGVLDNLIGLNVGTSIGQTLYLLATELLRFKNESVAKSQALQAEAARWRRELPEEGRRQRETRRRVEHNLMFAQLLEIYQDSINKLLVELVSEARENQAKEEAYEHAKEVARLKELERLGRPPTPPEEPVSADLLFALVAPEGLRELARTCLLILKQKYQEARKCLVERGQAEALEDSRSSTLKSEGTEDVMAMMDSLVEEIFTTVTERLGERPEESRSVVETASEESQSESVREAVAKTIQSTRSQEPKVLMLFEGKEPIEVMGSTSTVNIHHSTVLPSKEEEGTSFVYSEVSEMSQVWSSAAAEVESPAQCRSFGLRDLPRPSAEDRLLARVMRDMCYVASSLLHTAAKILNKAIQLAGIPQESFDEALRRTMLVINSALVEVIGLILPKKPEEKQPISEELILEASRIVDEILEKAKQRIAEMKEDEILKEFSPESRAKAVVDDVINEAQQTVLRMIVEDFLADLFEEALNKVSIASGEAGIVPKEVGIVPKKVSIAPEEVSVVPDEVSVVSDEVDFVPQD